MESILVKVSTEEYAGIIAQFPSNLPGDIENGCLCSINLTGEDQWMEITVEGGKAHRIIHCMPHRQIGDNQLIVKEDTYFNICNFLKLSAIEDSHNVLLNRPSENIFPTVAESVKVSPIQSCCDFSNEDEEKLLHFYFSKPRFLYVGDTIQIPLLNGALTKCPSYRGVSEVYFKVITASFLENENQKDVKGFYVLKGYSDLYCVTSSTSVLPPKPKSTVSLAAVSLARVPPDLDQYVSRLRSLFIPFMKKSQVGCYPFFILTGLSGAGKLETVNLVGQLLGLHVMSVNAYEFCNVGVSAAETKLDYLLQRCLKIGPCILAITNLELIGRDKGGNEDARLVDSFLTRLMSALKTGEKNPVLLVGLTDNKPEDLLPSVARAAVQVIKYQAMDASTAMGTLVWMAKKKGIEVTDSEIQPFVKKLNGFLHGDLLLLLDHATRNTHSRGQKCCLDRRDIQYALDLMEKAYSDSIGVAKVPDVKWDDVGGLTDVKEEVRLTLNMTSASSFGGGRLRRSGILFYGPPGTGKTLMAKAVATECSMNFLSVKGPELMNMYVGQSERNVREVFERGREAAPCILFFDELDSLAPNRGKSDGGGVTDRVVSQLLAEMDGLHSNRGLFVIAATNRPDLVDSALLRPGRFDKMFYLGPLADVDAKLGVLQALTNKFALSTDADLNRIAELCPACVTGADLYSVCSNAWLSSARRYIAANSKGQNVRLPLEVAMEDFAVGISELVPSLTEDDLRYYQQLASSASNK